MPWVVVSEGNQYKKNKNGNIKDHIHCFISRVLVVYGSANLTQIDRLDLYDALQKTYQYK